MNQCCAIIKNINLIIYYLFTWDENFKRWNVLELLEVRGLRALKNCHGENHACSFEL
jgi:hypothetical protein